MASVSPSMFGLHAAVPEFDLDPAWRPRVHQHVHTLAGMLQRLQTVVAGVHQLARCRSRLRATQPLLAGANAAGGRGWS